jgi:methylated-DNA-[protein]-cysteine S-methyltransferase
MRAFTFATSFGYFEIKWNESMVTGFGFRDMAPAQNPLPPPWIAEITGRVQAHLHGQFQDFSDLPFAFETVGDFPKQVYAHTLAVNPGATCSYGDIARKMRRSPGASRAVGLALGANPWPLLVPCHRVIASNGKMTGFSGFGGIKTKLRLLALEGAQLFAE